MIDTKRITIHTRWIAESGWFVWAGYDEHYFVDAMQLKTILFSWHEPSFFGTFLELWETDGKEGVLLPPDMALDYFTAPSPLAHQPLEWGVSAQEVLRLAPVLRDALLEGRFLPDFVKWQQGSWGWNISLEADEVPPFVHEWAERLIADHLDEWSAEQVERVRTLAGHPLIRIEPENRGHWTEDEWLIAIGWKEDPVPFRTALQLIEPEQDRGWLLQLVLQDRENEEIRCAFPDAFDRLPPTWQDHLERAGRDAAKMEQLLPWLPSADGGNRFPLELDDEAAWTFLTEDSLRLVEAGLTVLLPSWWAEIEKHKPRLVAQVKSSVGTFGQGAFGLDQLMDFDWKLSIGPSTLTEEQFADILKEKKRLIRLDGRWIQLDSSLLEKLQQIIRKAKRQNGLTLGEVLEAHLLQQDGQYEADMQVELNGSLMRMLKQLQERSSIPMVSPPAGLQATLRPYQAEGVSWLLFLRRFGLGGCLADDMGLGKTVQWISYLLSVKETEQPDSPSPSLLICPTSVLGNWQRELARFAPSLNVYVHYGSKRCKGEDFRRAIEGADLVLTTYTLSHLDQEELQSVQWDAIGLDEAQNIKNAYTKQATSIRKLSGRHRIAMTGTPIENRLTELWSIFDFINPGYLGSLREFTRRFVTPIEKEGHPGLVGQVQSLVRPFLLRRVKSDPAIQLGLPEKQESKEYLSLTVEQASLYETVLQDLFERLKTVSPMERRGLILAALTKLKQICNHPGLFLKEPVDQKRMDRSPKIGRLLEMVDELRQEGDRCLIFTQYVEMGHMLQQILEQERKEPVLFLHGGLSKDKRDQMIRRFQDESLPAGERAEIFILSLKAGGTGLNLTAANHVFHIDRWWNPAIENQATDRAYRIGQTRRVQVHKFIMMGTLEEKIDEMMERKQGLSEQIVGAGEHWITELSEDELKDLLALQRQWVAE